MDELTNEGSFDSQATWVIDVLGLFFVLTCYLAMGVCTTRHLKMSGRRKEGLGGFTSLLTAVLYM